MNDKEIAVIGAGQMGNGIAIACLQSGFGVVLVSRSEDSMKQGEARLDETLNKMIARGRLTPEQKAAFLLKLKTSFRMEDIRDAAIVIEAVPEQLKLKQEVLHAMERLADKDAILATNTSSILISRLAFVFLDQGRLIGLHFFNPVPAMKLVEVVVGKSTSKGTIDRSMAFIAALGKTPVKVNDAPGFVSNRILMPLINEAVLTLQNGVADKDGIDTVAKLGFNHPMGPLELADLIGLDVCVHIMESIHEETMDEKFVPARMLKELVQAGKLGRKTGEGFYQYSAQK